MDGIYLEYLMKTKGLSRQDLANAEGWSLATCSRKINGTSDWTINELKTLYGLGFSEAEIEKIFF